MERILAAGAMIPPALVVATSALEDVGGLTSDLIRPATIGAAMVVAYRITATAHRDSAATYREMAADAEARADAAEARLRVYQELADTRLRVLQDEIDRLRREIE